MITLNECAELIDELCSLAIVEFSLSNILLLFEQSASLKKASLVSHVL